MTKDEALKLALEALKSSMYPQPQQFRAITAIEKCLANDAVDCEPVVWMYQNKSTHEVRFQKHMRSFVDHGAWYEVPLYSEPLANQEKTSGSPIKQVLEQSEQEPVACVYKATTKKGETAHFGEYSAAKAWAGWGTVEQVPLKTLTLISKSINPCPTCEALARTVMLDQTSHDITPLYTSPPQRKPLSDEEIILIVADCASSHQHTDIHFARAIEAAHGIKEKNT